MKIISRIIAAACTVLAALLFSAQNVSADIPALPFPGPVNPSGIPTEVALICGAAFCIILAVVVTAVVVLIKISKKHGGKK